MSLSYKSCSLLPHLNRSHSSTPCRIAKINYTILHHSYFISRFHLYTTSCMVLYHTVPSSNLFFFLPLLPNLFARWFLCFSVVYYMFPFLLVSLTLNIDSLSLSFIFLLLMPVFYCTVRAILIAISYHASHSLFNPPPFLFPFFKQVLYSLWFKIEIFLNPIISCLLSNISNSKIWNCWNGPFEGRMTAEFQGSHPSWNF